jgi:uncharacterized protein (DUF362 family)
MPTWQAQHVVGIKVNVLNSRVPTHPELVRALVDSLKTGLSVPGSQILVWDRRTDELTTAKLTGEALGAVVEGTWEEAKSQGAGRGYENDAICIARRTTHLSKILTRRIDHLLNFSVMKNHDASGFTGCLKNNYGIINNPGDFHDVKQEEIVLERVIEQAIPDLNVLSDVTGKTRLWLMDAAIGICKGTTSDPEDCYPQRLLASLDPVAIDARGRELRDEMRGPKLGPDPETLSEVWLQSAERVGLGSKTPKLERIA